MTTGRINQVTVLRARHPQGAPHEAAGTRAHAPSPARVSHRPIQVVPPRPTPLDTPPLSGGVPSRCVALEVPSPPISHASEALPPVHRTGVGPFGGDYRRAAAPLVSRGLPERDVSPSGFLRTELAIGYQVHLPLRRSQQRQRRSAKLTLPGSSGVLFIVTHLESQATIPSQAGTSCKAGASTARPRDGQPSPQAASAGARSEHQGRSLRRSSRRSQHPRHFPFRAPKHTPTFGHRSSRQQPSRMLSSGPDRSGRVKGPPVPRLRGVKGLPVPSPSLAHGHHAPPQH